MMSNIHSQRFVSREIGESHSESRNSDLDITKATVRNPHATTNGSNPPGISLNGMVISMKARRHLLVQYGLRPTLPVNIPPSGGMR